MAKINSAAQPKADANLILAYINSNESENAKTAGVRQFFAQVFGKDNFTYESAANSADGYVKGRLVVELKTKHEDWLPGFYQALHYQKRGLGFAHVAVITHRFIGLWRLDKLPETARIFSHQALPLLAPNEVGRELAKKTTKALRQQILDAAQDGGFLFNHLKDDIDDRAKSATIACFGFLQKLRYLDQHRVPVMPESFLATIEEMQAFFDKPIEAVHAFYDIVRYWDITSMVPRREFALDTVQVVGRSGNVQSEPLAVDPARQEAFRQFVQQHYIFTNEGSGLTTDYYFSRFDEVMQRLDPAYVKQHGIFFTDDNLARFCLWFVDHYVDASLADNYVVLDPAGGSGNLVSAWRRHIRHKIVSELQPDLLRIIDRRLKADPWSVEQGFTIVPSVQQNAGLNFLDQPAAAYYQHLADALAAKHEPFDKPLAFLLNPPYKNTDENNRAAIKADANYGLDPAILELTGNDAGKERYLAFLGQIQRLAEVQTTQHPEFRPVLMVFTPTSWLLPRPTYVPFRAAFDAKWEYVDGLLTTSNEFFKLDGRWPLAFTVWRWREIPTPTDTVNVIRIRDLTHLTKQDFKPITWVEDDPNTTPLLRAVVDAAAIVELTNSRPDIREMLPLMPKADEILVRQTRYDFSRKKQEAERGQLVSGFALSDKDYHFGLDRKCGDANGLFIGFMDSLAPVRVKQDPLKRMSTKPDRIWFYLDTRVIGLNISKIFNGPPDKYGYCAYDLSSANACFAWFGVTKALNNNYPLWFNQYSLWKPDFTRVTPDIEATFYRLCFAYGLAENRCVELTFPADDPVPGAPTVRVENPLCPSNPDAFWATTLAPAFAGLEKSDDPAAALVRAVQAVYRHWAVAHAADGPVFAPLLADEPYFRYFQPAHPPVLTRRAGLVQLRKYAELYPSQSEELSVLLSRMRKQTTAVRQELHRVLVQDLKYFA